MTPVSVVSGASPLSSMLLEIFGGLIVSGAVAISAWRRYEAEKIAHVTRSELSAGAFSVVSGRMKLVQPS
ncbi:hypothetical protein, partial [Salibaculum sp.]|uniref:hypothetical protein n=1 Tax=Salibaculum sp. TaxID=2855480 RepID=UPI002B464AA1